MNPQSFERLTLVLSVVTVGLCLFVPLVVVSMFFTEHANTSANPSSTKVTVGIAVILRATARRLLRSGAKGVVRSTFATASRTVARTVTRRLVRFFTHSVAGIFSKQQLDDVAAEDARVSATLDDSKLAMLIGFLALCGSFWGVLSVVSHGPDSALASTSSFNVAVACLLAGLPLIIYGTMVFVFSHAFKASVRVVTELDGLLIQAYFTGAGSFLPMATDFECKGSATQKAAISAGALATLYAIHLVLVSLSWASASSLRDISAGLFLVYCFVYSFPISPLPGHDVWARSKLLWLGLFIPFFLSFLFAFPDELALII